MFKSNLSILCSFEGLLHKFIEVSVIHISLEALSSVGDHLGKEDHWFVHRGDHSLREGNHLLQRQMLFLSQLCRTRNKHLHFVRNESERYWVLLVKEIVEVKILFELFGIS